MRERRTQRAIRRETMMYVFGGLLVVAGAGLVVTAFLDDTSAARGSSGEIAADGSVTTTTDGRTTVPATDAPTTTTLAPPRSFTLTATGDILLHGPVNDAAANVAEFWGGDFDYRPMFDEIEPQLQAADLALCHLETPIAPTSADVRTGASFEVPHEIAVAIVESGYDGCSTASNHALDGGEDGIAATLNVFDQLALGHSGTARTAEEATTIKTYTAAGVPVAHLSYTYGLNGAELPEGRAFLVNLIDPERIKADAAAAKAAGAAVVVVSLHWGNEFTTEPTSAQTDVASALAQSPDIDLLIGHHAHVVQPVTRVGDLVVAYGLGNILSNQGEGPCCPVESQDGVVLEFRFTETGPGSGEFTIDDIAYTATWVENETYTIVPVAAALVGPDREHTSRATLEASQRRTDEAIGLLGPLAHPR